ncbi:Cerato-platanin [Obba rivulosa]|uniref:Cerato-platanin n=1 Tax=Obba rivulosa TaxID=1052685 RepID=A0A8E2AZ99_9APHY|nr:Cerato-platanin [Obba rivulosa]
MQSKRSIFAALAALSGVFSQSSTTISVSFDTIYGEASESLDVVACSQVIEQMGFTTFGTIPNFLGIGGAGVVTGFDAPDCELTFEETSISVFVIDGSAPGTFNIAPRTMNKLPNGQADVSMPVNAAAMQVDSSNCLL